MPSARDIANGMDKTPKLRAWRKWAGLTQHQVADGYFEGQGYLSEVETGKKPWSRSVLDAYSQKCGVDIDALFFDPPPKGQPLKKKTNEQQAIPLVGYVGAGGEIEYIDDHFKGGGLDEVQRIPGTPPNAVALKVRGDSMYPIFKDGTFIIYWERFEDFSHLMGEPVIVRIQDGRTLLKTISFGSSYGLFTLLSSNAPPIIDVRIDWAAEIQQVLKTATWEK